MRILVCYFQPRHLSCHSSAFTAAQLSVWDATLRYLPSLLTAAVITLVLSVLSMALAIVVGVLIASGRVYGPAPVKALLTGWVELIRGTPLLLQLFVIYY